MTILRAGRISQVVVVATFAATWFLPVAAAVGGGVILSLLQLNQEAMDLAVVELGPAGDGRFREGKPPATLPGSHVTILDVYGSLLYAGARTLQARLPAPGQTRSAVVVLRLRDRTSLRGHLRQGDDGLRQSAGRVGRTAYLSGVDHGVAGQFQRTGQVEGPIRTFEATPVVGESTNAAYLDAEAWLVIAPGE